MKLTHYIRSECFIPDLAEKSREDALRRIIHAVAVRGLVKDEKVVFAKLMEWENIQSTAVGNGIAIPHCFTDEIPDLIIIVARSLGGWSSIPSTASLLRSSFCSWVIVRSTACT